MLGVFSKIVLSLAETTPEGLDTETFWSTEIVTRSSIYFDKGGG
jgi:hypothetical protein